MTDEIEVLIAQAARSDQEEDQSYHDQTGYELPADLQFKQGQLSKIQAAKQAFEARKAVLNPCQPIDGKKISFADIDARIMGKMAAIHQGKRERFYYERTSIIITTNLNFGEWVQVFGDGKMTTA